MFASRERAISVTTSATYLVELEVRSDGAWGRDTTHAQIDTQTLDSTAKVLAKLAEYARSLGVQVRLTSTPVVVKAVTEYARCVEGS